MEKIILCNQQNSRAIFFKRRNEASRKHSQTIIKITNSILKV